MGTNSCHTAGAAAVLAAQWFKLSWLHDTVLKTPGCNTMRRISAWITTSTAAVHVQFSAIASGGILFALFSAPFWFAGYQLAGQALGGALTRERFAVGRKRWRLAQVGAGQALAGLHTAMTRPAAVRFACCFD